MSALGFTFLPKNWFLLGILIAVLGGHVVPGAGGALDPAGLTRKILIAALGVPLISTSFAAAPGGLGFFLLPLIFYHTWQLVVAGLLKSLLGKAVGSPAD